MPDYKELYYKLFAATEDALEALEKQNYGAAGEILIRVQQEAEEKYISTE